MRRGSSGFTLIELMIVISIMAVLVAMALPGFGYLSANTKIKSASTEIYLALLRSRSEAVKLNRTVTIVKNAAGWQAGWQIISDLGGADQRILANQGALKSVVVTMAEDSVEFRPSGRVGFPEPPAAVEFDISAENKDNADSLKRCVSVDITGKARIKTEACAP